MDFSLKLVLEPEFPHVYFKIFGQGIGGPPLRSQFWGPMAF